MQAFSIDDAATTEIDDAFSLTRLDNGNWRVGVHRRADAGHWRGQRAGKLVYNRLSTVYFPGDKITMLPDDAVNAFTLKEGQHCPAVSMYLEVARISPCSATKAGSSRCLSPPTCATTRWSRCSTKTPWPTTPAWITRTRPSCAGCGNSPTRWKCGAARPTRPPPQLDYNFAIEDGKVIITRRKRGAPMDKLVSELMILVNCEWGGGWIAPASRRFTARKPRAR